MSGITLRREIVMLKRFIALSLLASFTISTNFVFAGEVCKKKDIDLDNKINLENKEVCCCKPKAEGSNEHECEPVLSEDGKCPPERDIKVSLKIEGKRICVCDYTKK